MIKSSKSVTFHVSPGTVPTEASTLPLEMCRPIFEVNLYCGVCAGVRMYSLTFIAHDLMERLV